MEELLKNRPTPEEVDLIISDTRKKMTKIEKYKKIHYVRSVKLKNFR